MGKYLIEGLRSIKDDRIISVRGKGLMIGMEMQESFDTKKYL